MTIYTGERLFINSLIFCILSYPFISQFCRKMEPGNPIRTAPYSSYKFELTPVT